MPKIHSKAASAAPAAPTAQTKLYRAMSVCKLLDAFAEEKLADPLDVQNAADTIHDLCWDAINIIEGEEDASQKGGAA
jgi:hypothetical protein